MLGEQDDQEVLVDDHRKQLRQLLRLVKDNIVLHGHISPRPFGLSYLAKKQKQKNYRRPLLT